MIIRILLLVLCAAGIPAAQAHAQLFLEQGKVKLSVSGGDHPNGTLIIHNTSAQPAIMRIYWEDFEYKSPYDGTKNFVPAGTAPGSPSQWVTFSPAEFTLPAFGRQKVDYTVAVPDQIHEGHYGVLFFERKSDPLTEEKEVAIITRVGCLFFIEPKDKSKKAVLKNAALKDKSVTVQFVNQGNVIMLPRTTYYMMQTDGLVLLRGEANKIYVPAGATAQLEIPIKKALKQGQYTLVVNSDLDEGDAVVQEIGISANEAGQLTIENIKD